MPNKADIIINPAKREFAIFSEGKLVGIFKQWNTLYPFDETKDGKWGKKIDMLNRIEKAKVADANLIKSGAMADFRTS